MRLNLFTFLARLGSRRGPGAYRLRPRRRASWLRSATAILLVLAACTILPVELAGLVAANNSAPPSAEAPAGEAVLPALSPQPTTLPPTKAPPLATPSPTSQPTTQRTPVRAVTSPTLTALPASATPQKTRAAIETTTASGDAPATTGATPPTPVVQPAAAASPTPQPVANLLYLSGETLLRWDPLTNRATRLAQGVTQYEPVGSKQVLLLRSQPVVANGAALFEVSLLDLATRQIAPLLPETPRLHNLAISPNGEWLAYTSLKDGGAVNLLPLTPGEAAPEPHNLGLCLQERPADCTGLAWSGDSRLLLWSDTRGVWLANLEEGTASLATTDRLEVTDPRGGKANIRVSFRDLVWSPAGRFALATVATGSAGVHWQAIVDTRTGRVIEAPGSFGYAQTGARAMWLQSGNLFISEPGLSPDLPPRFSTWQVVATRNELLLIDKSFELRSPDFPAPAPSEAILSGYLPAWHAQTGTRLVSFAISLPGSQAAPALFRIDLKHGLLEKLFELPFSPVAVLWSPEGAALTLGEQNQVLYAAPDAILLDLRPVLGSEAGTFTWLAPPAP